MVPQHFRDIAVNRTTSSASSTRTAVVLIAVALAISGCGRKGMLDLPPNAPVQPTAAAGGAPEAETASRGTLFDPSYGMNNAPTAPQGRKKSFILDPLLND
jgi:predicted small lipoprotein YifL